MEEIFAKYEKYKSSQDPKKLKELKKNLKAKKKEELERRYKDGYSILTHACKDGKTELVSFLLRECRLDPNCRDHHRKAGIHYAAHQGLMEVIGPLVDFGGDVDIKTGKDNTPLILAVKGDKAATVKMLLSFGADKNIGTIKPLELARDRGSASMIRVLEGSLGDEQITPEMRHLYKKLISVEHIAHRVTLRIKPQQKSADMVQLNEDLKNTREAFDSGTATIQKEEIKCRLSSMEERLYCTEERLDRLDEGGEKAIERINSLEKSVLETNRVVNELKDGNLMLVGISKTLTDQQGKLNEVLEETLKRNSAMPPYYGVRYVPDPTANSTRVPPIQENAAAEAYTYIQDDQNAAENVSFYVEGQQADSHVYVEPIEDIYEEPNMAVATTAQPCNKPGDPFTVEVLYEYIARQPSELTIRRGDVITHVTARDDGWWEGNLGRVRGHFPSNLVKKVSMRTAPPVTLATNKARPRMPEPLPDCAAAENIYAEPYEDIIPERARNILKKNLDELSRNVRLESLYPALFSDNLITDHQLQQIQNGCDQKKMAFEIFNDLQRGSRATMRRMKTVLRRKQPHIAGLIPDC